LVVAECVELEVPPSNEFLAVVRTVTATLASVASQLPDARIDDLRLAVTEACANAVDAERRKPDDRQLPIRLKLEVDGDKVAVEVHDEGGGFDPDALTAHPPPNRPERLAFERGLGIPLMRALADDVEFRAEGGGTTVRLVISLRQRGAVSD
jgi:anti-sigma regulatory factor (Ser/Thr protein kinase)